MKVHIINHRCGDDEIEVKNGIRVFDWVGMEFMKAEKNMTVQDLIDELMLVKDKSKEIRVVVNTNDYITSYPASLFDMSIKEGEDIAKDHFDNIIAIELYR